MSNPGVCVQIWDSRELKYKWLEHLWNHESMFETLSNDISSEATGPIKPKCHLWYPWAGGLKVYVFMKIVIFVWLLWNLDFP